MKTVVYQSYRTEDVPGWITRCLKSVRDWAGQKGFDYEFIDDRLFDHVPDWFREKVNANKVLMSDLARLELAREFLGKGYARTIWVDADVVVFDPDRFDIPITEEYGFCHEVWVGKTQKGIKVLGGRVNNAVAVFAAGNSMLDFYIHASKSIVGNRSGQFRNPAIGTVFLTGLHRALRFPLIGNVGLFSPPVLDEIADRPGEVAKAYMEAFGRPIRAANLCASFRNRTHDGISMTDSIYDRAVENLLRTEGRALNDHLAPRGQI